MTIPEIGVVVPTYRRRDALLRLIETLAAQTHKDFEVIVVDNGSSVDLRSSLDEVSARSPDFRVRYVQESRLGNHHARHRGAAMSSAEVLVFFDDDMTVDPDALSGYAAAFEEHPLMVAAGGPVHPRWAQPPPSWLSNYIGDDRVFPPLSLMDLGSEQLIGPDLFFFSNNMAIRRAAFLEIGGFSPEAFGDTWLGNGEAGLIERIKVQKWLIGYVPQARAWHHIPEDRMTLAYLLARHANEGRSNAYSRYHPAVPSRSRLLWDAFGILFRNWPVWLLATLVYGRSRSRVAIKRRVRTSMSLAELRYVIRLLFDEDLRRLVSTTHWSSRV